MMDDGQLHAELLARVGAARDPYDRAVWQLLLGDAEEGLAGIRRGLPELIALTPANLRLAQIALLADDASAQTIAAAASEEALERFVPGNREYHATMLALMSGDEDRARDLQVKLDAFVSTHDKLRGGQPARVAKIARGLLDREAPLCPRAWRRSSSGTCVEREREARTSIPRVA